MNAMNAMNVSGIIEHITGWLKDYASRSGTNGFVIGISGGIDSAITSTLGARTGLPVLCLEMPIHQPKTHVERAVEHMDWLKSGYPNVQSIHVPLSDTYDQLVSTLVGTQVSGSGGRDDLPAHQMALVNTRARLRMTTLYYHAAVNNRLVLGTGNKVEDFGVGFFTKYGDGGVDISPIADLTKTQVYALGRELGIIDHIMDAPPTDGLWGDDRTDEDQLGASYPELEWAMKFDVEFNGDETILSPREAEVLAIYRRLHGANQHKMEPIPVCVIPTHLMKP